MIRLFNYQTVDTFFFYIFITCVVVGCGFYIYKYHNNLISERNIQILLAICFISIVSIITLKHFNNNPAGNIYYTKFKDAGALKIGSQVIYRGVTVGKVLDISITPDSRFALVKFIITDKNTRIPKKSHTELSFRGLTGSQPLYIKPPRSNDNFTFLANDEYLNSDESKTFEEMEMLLNRLIREGKIESIVDNINQLVKNTSEITKAFNETLEETTELVKSVKKTNDNINQVLQDGKIAGELKTTVNNANKTVKKFERVADKTDHVIDKSKTVLGSIQNTVDKVDSHLNDQTLNDNIQTSAQTLKDILEDIQDITGNDALRGHIKNSIIKSSELSTQATCLTKGVSNMVGKRFLLPKLILGKPGKTVNTCKQNTLIEMENINALDKRLPEKE